MDQWIVITLRIVHILTAAIWVGTAFLVGIFIGPAARRMGPEQGSRYLNTFLDQRWFSGYISAAEGLAVLSGLVLYWNASGTFDLDWITSNIGLGFTVGALSAIAAIVLSIRLSGLLGSLYSIGEGLEKQPNDRDLRLQFGVQHAQLARATTIHLWLLVVAVSGMASAQYLI